MYGGATAPPADALGSSSLGLQVCCWECSFSFSRVGLCWLVYADTLCAVEILAAARSTGFSRIESNKAVDVRFDVELWVRSRWNLTYIRISTIWFCVLWVYKDVLQVPGFERVRSSKVLRRLSGCEWCSSSLQSLSNLVAFEGLR